MSGLVLARPPVPPELPDGARPRWPAWYGFAAMGAGTVVVSLAGIPLIPLVLFSVVDGAPGAVALLVLVLVQDVVYVGTAVAFAWLRQRPRAWHFGLRRTPTKRTLLLTLGVTLAVLGFEIGFFELVEVDESKVDELGGGGDFVAALAISLAAVVVAPVMEELFFRAFLYRALRNRMGVALACAVNGVVFAAVHLQYLAIPEVYVTIAVFAVAACLLYEATGSVLPCIAIHAIFNTVALSGTDAGYLAPIAVGVAVVAACAVASRMLAPGPSPFPA